MGYLSSIGTAIGIPLFILTLDTMKACWYKEEADRYIKMHWFMSVHFACLSVK